MEYIRVKDGCHEWITTFAKYDEARNKATELGLTYSLNIIKQSDDLKELLDGYYLDIDNHPFNRIEIYNQDELDRAFDEKMSWQNYSDRKGLEYKINLYGFIKTNKGFVFVAKVNEKENLVVL